MELTKLDSQGRITIPAEIRKKWGVVPGQLLGFELENNKLVVRKVEVTPIDNKKT